MKRWNLSTQLISFQINFLCIQTFEKITIAIFHLQLHIKWAEIYSKWEKPTQNRRHCKQNAPPGSFCSTNDWFCICPYQPGSECHELCSNDESTLFFALSSIVYNWWKELRTAVDLDGLRIDLIVIHDVITDTKHLLTKEMARKFKTIRDDNNETKMSKIKFYQILAYTGYPSKTNTFIWILTTWQSWSKIFNATDEKHDFSFMKNKKKIFNIEMIRRVHVSLAIVDENHIVKNIEKGPWRILEDMRHDRPSLRFWFVTFSGTMLNAGPVDILTPINIMSDATWNDKAHPLHAIRPAALKAMKKVLTKHVEHPKNEEAETTTNDSIKIFGTTIPLITIRRHDDNEWRGKSLIELPSMRSKIYNSIFPAQYQFVYEIIFKNWQISVFAQLKKR